MNKHIHWSVKYRSVKDMNSINERIQRVDEEPELVQDLMHDIVYEYKEWFPPADEGRTELPEEERCRLAACWLVNTGRAEWAEVVRYERYGLYGQDTNRPLWGLSVIDDAGLFRLVESSYDKGYLEAEASMYSEKWNPQVMEVVD